MVFKEYTYSVLLVSSSEKFSGQLASMLPENEFGPVYTVCNAGEARRRLSELDFDIIIINSPLTDEFGGRLAADIAADSKRGVLMFVKSDMYEEITAKVIDFGVLTVSKPASSSIVHQILKIMYAIQEKFRMLEKKTVTLEQQMENIRVINHA